MLAGFLGFFQVLLLAGQLVFALAEGFWVRIWGTDVGVVRWGCGLLL